MYTKPVAFPSGQNSRASKYVSFTEKQCCVSLCCLCCALWVVARQELPLHLLYSQGTHKLALLATRTANRGLPLGGRHKKHSTRYKKQGTRGVYKLASSRYWKRKFYSNNCIHQEKRNISNKQSNFTLQELEK